MKNRADKPLHPTLSGLYGKMTAKELDAVSDAYDKPLSGLSHRKPSKAMAARLAKARRRGRPPKPASDKYVKVNVTFRPELLERADAYAKRIGTTRAGLIDMALTKVLARP